MKRFVTRAIAAMALVLSLATLCFAERDPLNLQETIWGQEVRKHNLDPYLLYAIALVESGRIGKDSLVRPSPYAVFARGSAKVHPTHDQAVLDLWGRLKNEKTNVNLGAMQVNLRWHKHRVELPEDLLDFETNIAVGAQILAEAYRSHRDKDIAVGRYRSWREDSARPYGEKINRIATDLKHL